MAFITDSKGNVIGYDTGKQSILIPSSGGQFVRKISQGGRGGSNRSTTTSETTTQTSTAPKQSVVTETPQQQTKTTYTPAQLREYSRNQLIKGATETDTAYNARVNAYTKALQSRLQSQSVQTPQTTLQNQIKQVFQSSLEQGKLQKLFEDEISRYKSFGYSQTQAGILAQESANRGGYSFTEKGAAQFLKSKRTPEQTEKIKEEQFQQYIEQTPLKELAKKTFTTNGELLPYLIRRTSTETFGKGVTSISEPLRLKLGVGEKLTTQQRKELNKIVGDFGLFAFFSPVFQTGAAKQKQIQEQLSKNKFEELSKALDKANKLEKDLLNKKSALEQTKFLNKIAGELKDEKAKEGFAKWVIEQYEKGNYKGIPLTLLQKNQVKDLTVFLPKLKDLPLLERGSIAVPQMKYAGLISGLIAAIPKGTAKQKVVAQTKNQELIRFSQLPLGVRFIQAQIESEKSGLPSLATTGKLSSGTANLNKSKVNSLSREITKLKSSLKSAQTPIQKSLLKSSIKQKERQLQRLTQRQIQQLRTLQREAQLQQQLQRQRLRLKQRLKRPRKFRKIPRIPPIIPPPIELESSGKTKFKLKVPKPHLHAYSIFIYKKETPFKIGVTPSKTKAFKILKNKLDQEIEASGFVALGSKRIKPKTSKFFRLSRNPKRPNVLVERRKIRISTKGEKLTLKASRKPNLKSTKLIRKKNARRK